MRVCPKCQTVHPDGTEFCPDDGRVLEEPIGTDFEVAATAFGPAAVHDTSHQPTDGEGDGRPDTRRRPRTPAPGGSSQDLVGKTLGGVYHVIEQIGVGGMGEVYRVEHVNLKKQYALKVLTKVAQDHPEAVERFKQEAISASHIEHDNIVDIITLQQTDEGHPYIVMELLKGESLADALSEGEPLPVERALNIAYQICSALHAAHEDGIIHRDLKPENVYLTKKGDTEFVKILDFGISKIRDAESDRVRITRTGQFLGTPLYMSPEQAKGEPNLDRRVDIYSLGVLLYEMLEGKTPFTGENYFQLIWKHSNEEAPPMIGSAPEKLKQVVVKALSKDPDSRYSSMIEMEDALLAAVPETPPPAFLLDHRPSAIAGGSLMPRTPVAIGARAWIVAAGLGGAVAILVVLAVRGTGQGDDPAASTGPTDVVGDTVRSDASPVTDRDVAASSDGGSDAVGTDGSPVNATGRKVRIAVATDPSGVEVFLGEERLGVTPLEVERAASPDTAVLRLVKPGYRVVRRDVGLEHDISLDERMTKQRPVSPIPSDVGVPIKRDL